MSVCIVNGEVGLAGHCSQVHGSPALQCLEEDLFSGPFPKNGKPGQRRGVESSVTFGIWFHHGAATQSGLRRANDEEVSLYQGDRILEPELRPAFLAGRQIVAIQEAYPRRSLAGACMEGNGGVVL